jgi:hypothetical protein
MGMGPDATDEAYHRRRLGVKLNTQEILCRDRV